MSAAKVCLRIEAEDPLNNYFVAEKLKFLERQHGATLKLTKVGVKKWEAILGFRNAKSRNDVLAANHAEPGRYGFYLYAADHLVKDVHFTVQERPSLPMVLQLDLPETGHLPEKNTFIHYDGQTLDSEARRAQSAPPLEASSGVGASSAGQVRADVTIARPLTPRREVLSPERSDSLTPSQRTVGTQTQKDMSISPTCCSSPTSCDFETPHRSRLGSDLGGNVPHAPFRPDQDHLEGGNGLEFLALWETPVKKGRGRGGRGRGNKKTATRTPPPRTPSPPWPRRYGSQASV